MLYGDWLMDWLELYVKVSTKERTYKKYCQQVKKYILPHLGGKDTEELTGLELQKFYVKLTGLSLSASTINCVLTILKSSLKRGVMLGVISKQYSDSIKRPKIKSREISCFGKNEQKKLEKYILDNINNMSFGILLCLYTGLRIGELLALTWGDVDFKSGTMLVTKSCHDSWEQGHYVKVIDATKTASSERIVPIPKQILCLMKSLKKTSQCRYVVEGSGKYGAEVRIYQRTFSGILKSLNITHRGFHALRHTFATRAMETGMDVKTLSEILGHKNPMITLTYYSHSLLEHKKTMMNKLGKLLE